MAKTQEVCDEVYYLYQIVDLTEEQIEIVSAQLINDTMGMAEVGRSSDPEDKKTYLISWEPMLPMGIDANEQWIKEYLGL